MLLIFLLVPSLLLFVVWWYMNHSPRVRLAEKLPGPKTEFLLGNVREFGTSTEGFFRQFLRVSKEHGQLIRIWLGPFLYVIVSNPDDVEIVMASSKHIDKAVNYDFLKPWLGTGLLTSTGQKWHKNRKIITPTFHFKILEQFIDVFNNNGVILIETLKKEVNGPSFDIFKYVTLCTLDIICETAMGVSVNAQKDSESEYVRAVRQISDVTIHRFLKPWLYFDFILSITRYGRLQSDALAVLHNSTNEVIRKRKQQLLKIDTNNGYANNHEEEGVIGQKKRLAFLDLLLLSAQNGANISDESIREEVDTFMFEGHDTTTSGICFILFLLAKHQDIQDKVVEELQGIFGCCDDITPSYQNLNDMKYLERVVKESLRLYPSVPAFGRQINEDMPIKSSGFVIPAGTSIVISPYVIHRNPEYFPDPEKFDPDRFLADSVQGRHPYAYIPFSAGPRNCIGQKFAMLEMKVTVSKALWHYQLLVDPSFVPEPVYKFILKSSNGIPLKIAPRNRRL